MSFGAFSRAFSREVGFLRRDRVALIWFAVVLGLTSLAVAAGLREVAHQHATLTHLLAEDAADRQSELARQEDWGGAAYYSFHLTYDPPSAFAFAALGQRDVAPWTHRIRMLALEGQIHERDAANPVLALTGRFDVAFVAAFLLPLVLIGLLHDLHARERAAVRHELITATAGRGGSVWGLRGALRAAGVAVAAVLPLVVGGVVSGTPPQTLALGCAAVVGYVAVWAVVLGLIARWRQSSAVLLATGLGVWVTLAVLVPAGARLAIDRAVPIPPGAEVLMTQREAVNDAWDLPKEVTMAAFVARHPEWAGSSTSERPFDWRWYYAFQQVGDQTAEPLSQAYTAGRARRDALAGQVAWFSPPALLERTLQRLARTDTAAMLAYEGEVRAFHAALRAHFYPKLFHEEPFEAEALTALPRFAPGDRSGG